MEKPRKKFGGFKLGAIVLIFALIMPIFSSSAMVYAANNLPKKKTFYLKNSRKEYDFKTTQAVTLCITGEGMMDGFIYILGKDNLAYYDFDVDNEDIDEEVTLLPGEYTIYANSNNEEKVKITYSFKASKAKTVTYDSSMKLGHPYEIGTQGLSGKLTYSVNKKGIVTVSKDGVVSATKAGNVVVTVKNSKYSVKINLSVKPPIGIGGGNAIAVGKKETYSISYEVYPFDVEEPTCKWSSSNKKIATVDKNGCVTGLKKGKVTITAKLGSYKFTKEIEVVDNQYNGYVREDINPYGWEYSNDGAWYLYTKSIKYNKDGSLAIAFYVGNDSYDKVITGFNLKVLYEGGVLASQRFSGLEDEFNTYDLLEYSFTIDKKNVFKSESEVDFVHGWGIDLTGTMSSYW